MISRSELVRLVQDRAAGRCEYCRMHQSLQGATFHLEHIVPKSCGGPTSLENLALACPSCNLRKSDRIEAVDPESGTMVPLFHPRAHRWAEHFRWQGYRVVGTTSVGRATVLALDLNDRHRIRIRQAEETFDLFPPPDIS